MDWIKQAGVGTLCLTWWGHGSDEEKVTDGVFAAAAAAGLKVNFHIEPYAGRTPASLAANVRYLLQRYGQHPAFFRAASLGHKPVFYVFESVKSAPADWKAALDAMRPTLTEPVLLIAQTTNLKLIQDGGFDGGYPYDGLVPFKDPAFLERWQDLAAHFKATGKLFIPSVGPGYWDDRAVPDGAREPESAKTRDDGKDTTYDSAWQAAIDTSSPFITITSFNEWHEGSQIEPAIDYRAGSFHYASYTYGPDSYLNKTARWVAKFAASRK